MPASFDGNDGNDGNSANSGGGGNATSISAGWFFADRVNLPFVTELDAGPNAASLTAPTIGQLPIINAPKFPYRNWSAEWYSWLALTDFVATGWKTINPSTQAGWPTWVPFPAPGGPSSINLTDAAP